MLLYSFEGGFATQNPWARRIFDGLHAEDVIFAQQEALLFGIGWCRRSQRQKGECLREPRLEPNEGGDAANWVRGGEY